jgi:hypothetical protein
MVVFLLGDNKQLAPVVKGGSMYDIIQSSPVSSTLFAKFKLYYFTVNMRLLDGGDYGEMLLEVGKGTPLQHTTTISTDPSTSMQIIRIPMIQTTLSVIETLGFLYPDGFNADIMHTRCILASKYYAILSFKHNFTDLYML